MPWFNPKTGQWSTMDPEHNGDYSGTATSWQWHEEKKKQESSVATLMNHTTAAPMEIPRVSDTLFGNLQGLFGLIGFFVGLLVIIFLAGGTRQTVWNSFVWGIGVGGFIGMLPFTIATIFKAVPLRYIIGFICVSVVGIFVALYSVMVPIRDGHTFYQVLFGWEQPISPAKAAEKRAWDQELKATQAKAIADNAKNARERSRPTKAVQEK